MLGRFLRLGTFATSKRVETGTRRDEDRGFDNGSHPRRAHYPRISDALRLQAEQQVARVAATNAQQRVAEALYLVATSPEFAVQR